MNPQEKRKQTIIQRYGSFSNMLKQRDIRDLILGGISGGRVKTQKGFAKWQDGQLSRFAKARQRDSKGRFISEAGEAYSLQDEDTEG